LLAGFDCARTGNDRERTVSELMSTANLAFSEFAEMLKILTGAGLVRLFGEPGAESVALTDKGMAVLDLVS